MSNSIKPSSAVVESMAKESSIEIAKEYAEIGIDAVLSDGVLKDIPVVNTLVALGKIGVSIHDRILVKKLLAFLGSAVHRCSRESGYGTKTRIGCFVW